MSTAWRPLVGQGKLPWWARLRDVVLTLLAWMVLVWFLRHLLLVLWIGLRELAGVPLDLQGRSLAPRWDVLLPYLQAAAGLILLLAVLAWQRRHWLRAQPPGQARAEPVLDPMLHAAHFGLDLGQLAALREGQVRVVRFDGDGRMVGVEPPPRLKGVGTQAAAPTGT